MRDRAIWSPLDHALELEGTGADDAHVRLADVLGVGLREGLADDVAGGRRGDVLPEGVIVLEGDHHRGRVRRLDGVHAAVHPADVERRVGVARALQE